MKPKRSRTFLRNLKRSDPFAIPTADWPHEKELTEIVSRIVSGKSPAQQARITADAEVPADYLKALVLIATNTWRAKMKMLDATTGEVREEMKRVHRHIEAICRGLADVGVVIRDHTGDAYDEGQPMKVVASKPKPGLDKERVCETLLPSIFWNNRLVQNGEIVTETPTTPNASAESQPLQT